VVADLAYIFGADIVQGLYHSAVGPEHQIRCLCLLCRILIIIICLDLYFYSRDKRETLEQMDLVSRTEPMPKTTPEGIESMPRS
jgi:hypothetical protein